MKNFCTETSLREATSVPTEDAGVALELLSEPYSYGKVEKV
jgi:hypothetical protein